MAGEEDLVNRAASRVEFFIAWEAYELASPDSERPPSSFCNSGTPITSDFLNCASVCIALQSHRICERCRLGSRFLAKEEARPCRRQRTLESGEPSWGETVPTCSLIILTL